MVTFKRHLEWLFSEYRSAILQRDAVCVHSRWRAWPETWLQILPTALCLLAVVAPRPRTTRATTVCPALEICESVFPAGTGALLRVCVLRERGHESMKALRMAQTQVAENQTATFIATKMPRMETSAPPPWA